MNKFDETYFKSCIKKSQTTEELLDVRDEFLTIRLESEIGSLERLIYDKIELISRY